MLLVHKSRIGLAACAWLALAFPALAAEEKPRGIDKYLPDDTEVVMTMNVRQILDSAAVKKHALDKIKELLKSNDQVQTVLTSLGLDPFKDVDAVISAGPAVSPGGSAENSKGLLIVQGKFDPAKFQAKAEEAAKENPDHLKIQKVGNYTLYEASFEIPNLPLPLGPQTLYVALAGKTTVVASPSKDYVTDALDKHAGKKKTALKKEIKALLEKIPADESLSIALTSNALSKLFEQPAQQSQQFKSVLDKLESVTLGIKVAADANLEITLATKNAASAMELEKEIKDLLDTGKGFLALAAGEQKELAPVMDAVEKIKITAEGAAVKIKAHVPADLIEKAANIK